MNWRVGLLVLAVSVLAPMITGCGGSDNDLIPFPQAPDQVIPEETRTNVLSLGNVILPQGVLTPVEVRLVNPSNVAGVQGRILYDASLFEVVNPATLPGEPSAIEGGLFSSNVLINYEENRAPVNGQKGVTFALGRTDPVNTDGRLFRLWFRTKAGAAANAGSALKLDPDFRFLFAGPQGEVLTSHVSEGSLIVGP